jgi:hypothetical protein
MIAEDFWTCNLCGYIYVGLCRPHEKFGDSVEEVGTHLWDVHMSVKPSSEMGIWEHKERLG